MTAAPLHLSLAIIEGRHLLGLVDEFIALLDGPRDPADGGLNRLAPDPYPDDAESSAEYRRSTRDDLFDQRLADALDVRTTLEDFDGTLGDAQDVMLSRTVTIQPDRVNGWLRTLSAIRLVLASRLGVEREDAHDPEDPRFGTYDWLGYRLDTLVTLADDAG